MTSSRGVSTSCGVSTSPASPGHGDAGPGKRAGAQLATSDSNRLQEEEQAALLAREREKERQKEAARCEAILAPSGPKHLGVGGNMGGNILESHSLSISPCIIQISLGLCCPAVVVVFN